ncbi:MAG: hypothetical protein KIT47_17420 [Rhodoferax sp.]|nr:hypothetical protein [Rhodoferax sp.]
MELIKRLFGGPFESGGATSEPVFADSAHQAQDFAAQLPTRCELLRVRTRNTLRMAGIPEAWVEPQVLVEPQGRRTFLHLRLVVRHWDERLLRYAVAFQTRLMSEIERIDPQAREWLLSIVWCFPPDMASPYPELPQPSAWLDAEPQPQPQPLQASEQDDVQSDLAQLLALRDAELTRSESPGDVRGH